MAPHVVGLQGHTGHVGNAALKALITGHDSGKFKLVVLHRPGSDLSKVPKQVETRVLNLDDPDPVKIKAAVEGLNVYLSLVAIPGLGSQVHLLKPLGETPGFVTYLSPVLGNPRWTTFDKTIDPRIGGLMSNFHHLLNGPGENGFGLTRLQTGVFASYFFDHQYLGSDIDENKVILYKDAAKNGVAIASADCLGDAIATSASRKPEEIKDKVFHAFDYYPTGDEIIKAFEEIRGTKPTVIERTEAEYQQKLDEGGMAASPYVYLGLWGTNTWGWEGERLGEEKKDFLKLAKSYWAERSRT